MPSITSTAASAIAFDNSMPAPHATSMPVECVPAISPHPLELVICQVERVPGEVVLTVAAEVVSNGATLVLTRQMPESQIGIDGVLPRLGASRGQ